MSNSSGKATVSDIYDHLINTTHLGQFVEMYMNDIHQSETKKRGDHVTRLALRIDESRAIRDAQVIGKLWDSIKEVLSKHLTIHDVETTQDDTHCVPTLKPSNR